MKQLIILISVASLLACNNKPHNTKTQIEAESKKANAFFDSSFHNMLDDSPLFQTYLGIKKDYDKWDDLSEEKAKKDLEIAKTELTYIIDSINYNSLDPQTKVSYQLFKLNLEDQINGFKYRHHDYPINQMFGTHTEVPSTLINMHIISNKDDAEKYIARISNIPHLFDQLITGLEIRESKGIVPPKFVFPWAIEASKNLLKGFPFEKMGENAILKDFSTKVNTLDIEDKEKKALITQCESALLTSMKPAYEKLISFLEGQEERATTDDGVWKFPEGDAFFNFALQKTTTTNLTSQEIFDIGNIEVKRIHGEMENIMKKVGFEGDLQAFFTFMKTDEQFYYPNTDEGKQEYLDSAIAIIDIMKGKLDDLFITKPKASLDVKRVEAFREKSAGKAFYQSPSPDGSRPGRYYVNLYNTQNMPKYEMEALAYHEGLPGHHMDRSISQELTGIPEFRKHGGYTGFIEGWGLYCEYLPKELGMYQDPYSDFGRLSMELWRACRLVVDCGIHSKKWTREQGIEFYKNNTPASERECERMVERHIVMPSQATAYKIGMIKILELREKSKLALGDKFDIRGFHEVVLTNGSVPLNVLEDLVDNWISSVNG